MQQEERTSEYFIKVAQRIINLLPEMSFDDDILGAKAFEAGVKLSTQLCILRLRQLGMSHGQISQAEGINVSPDAVLSWYDGEYFPEPPKFKALVELYTNTDNTLWRARQIKTPSI
ncbi:hypothetical protein ACFLW8_03875 [Chloroflexota bacterium]